MKVSDYFVMISGGCSGYQAILINMVTSLTTFIAAIVVISLKDVSHHLLNLICLSSH